MYKNKHSATNKLMKFLETNTNQLTLHKTFSSQNNVTMNKVFIRSQFLVTALILVNLTFVITKSAQEWPSKATESIKVRLLMIVWPGFFWNINVKQRLSNLKTEPQAKANCEAYGRDIQLALACQHGSMHIFIGQLAVAQNVT